MPVATDKTYQNPNGATGEGMLEEAKLTVNTQEIQQLTGLGRDRIRTLVRSGVLPNVSGSPRRVVVPRTALEKYLQGQK